MSNPNIQFLDINATEVTAPSRVGVAYRNPLPAPSSPDRAETREELIEIANYHAFYRESVFTVTLGSEAKDVNEELNYLYRNSGFLPSLCAVFGSLENETLTVTLKFYPETYLVVPRSTVPATFLGGENDPPNGTDTLPGLDPVNGISVWDSEQACYALSHGYKIAPIPGSPAEELVGAARQILAEIVDDTMTPFQILYRVYVYLLNRAVYDYDGETWIANTLDREFEPDMLASRMISFRAEGPLIYEVGVCFGFAKASVLLLGLEGLEVRRAVAFDGRIKARSYVYSTADQPDRCWILVHSYDYIRIDGLDYLFDPTFAFNGTYQVPNTSGGSDKISVFRDFAIGMSYEKHREAYPGYAPDPFAASEEYKPGHFDYLHELTYDGTHSLMLSSKEEAQICYDYLLRNFFSGEPECHALTLLFDNVAYDEWKSQYLSDLDRFLKATEVPFKFNYYAFPSSRTVADVMVYIAFDR